MGKTEPSGERPTTSSMYTIGPVARLGKTLFCTRDATQTTQQSDWSLSNLQPPLITSEWRATQMTLLYNCLAGDMHDDHFKNTLILLKKDLISF